MNRICLLTWITLACLLPTSALPAPDDKGDTTPETPETALKEGSLPDHVIARIEGTDIPSNWFGHEFRTSFFQDGNTEEARQKAFEKFMRKMTLYALSKKEGLLDDPRLRSQIDERVAKQRDYFEYQLAMTEVNAGIQAYLTLFGITPQSIVVGEVELDTFIEKEMAKQSHNPFADAGINIPDEIREQYRQQLARQKHQDAILQHLTLQEDLVETNINGPAIEKVLPPKILPAAE